MRFAPSVARAREVGTTQKLASCPAQVLVRTPAYGKDLTRQREPSYAANLTARVRNIAEVYLRSGARAIFPRDHRRVRAGAELTPPSPMVDPAASFAVLKCRAVAGGGSARNEQARGTMPAERFSMRM